MRELVQRMLKIAGRAGLGAFAGEREVFGAGKNLQLINTRLAAATAGDGEAHEPRLDGGKSFDVMLGRHCRAFASRSNVLSQLRLQLAHAFLHCGHLGLVSLAERQVAVGVFHALEDTLERVVVVLRNGIKLVVVATRAAGGEAEENRAGGVDHVVQFIGALHAVELAVLPLHDVVWPGDEKTRAQRFAQRIAGNLLAHKIVVGLVLIKRANHPVAIRPRVVPLAVGFKAGRFAKAHEVQPMRRPPLTITRAGQHLIHQPRERSRLVILHKRFHLLRRWR